MMSSTVSQLLFKKKVKSSERGNPESNNHSSIGHSSTASFYEEREKEFESGAVFTGKMRNGKRHGFGIQVWPDGAKYEGNWKNDKTDGKGKFWHANGDYFEGIVN
jgi:hypothetical protein